VRDRKTILLRRELDNLTIDEAKQSIYLIFNISIKATERRLRPKKLPKGLDPPAPPSMLAKGLDAPPPNPPKSPPKGPAVVAGADVIAGVGNNVDHVEVNPAWA